MRNILIVTHHYLSGNGGGVFASRAYINAVASLSNSVTLLYPDKYDRHIEKVLSHVNAIPVRYDKCKILKLIDLAMGKINRFGKAFRYLLNQKKFDYVFFDNSKASSDLIDFAHEKGCKVITIHHNYEYEYNRDNYHGVVKYLNLFWVKKYECEAVTKSDLNLTLTVQDKCLLLERYGGKKPIEVIGCFEYERTAVLPSNVNFKRKMNRFVITGNLSSVQTEVSLLCWLEQYYPLLIREYPDAQLTIAGKNPSSRLFEKCKDLKIRVVPSPKDINTIINEADFYICPTSLGGGLKLRIMDGLKVGLPVLTHEISARGYDIFKDKCLFPYHDSVSFVCALKKTCDCNLSNVEIINMYQSTFSFDAGVNRLNHILENYILI